ncbi:MAG: ArnT family glycosyltransferase [Tepidisphaeraceae bacterium]
MTVEQINFSKTRRPAPQQAPSPGLPRVVETTAIILLVALGLLLRTWGLGDTSLFVDEAESCVNALTIQEYGWPADRYLGMPIFENTLTLPWPENPEYEFKDTSYSDRCFAIYHGWMPLYAIAATQKLMGIAPDRQTLPGKAPAVRAWKGKHGEEIARRNIAGRAPSVAFGVALMLLAWAAGRAMYGADAGLTAIAISAVAPNCVWAARQARYYSATTAVMVLCCLALFLVIRHGRWRDFVLAGVAYALLFHTHVISFAAACAVMLLATPWVLRRAGQPTDAGNGERHRGLALAKLATFGAIVAAATLPWLLITGYFDHFGRMTPAREMLSAAGWVQYLRTHPGLVALLLAGTALVPMAMLWPRASRLAAPLRSAAGPVAMLVAWVVVGYLAFMLLIPAASFFMGRLTYIILGPTVLLGALLLTAGARLAAGWVGRPALSLLLAPIAALAGVAYARPDAYAFWRERHHEEAPIEELVEYLRATPMAPGTRLYGVPYHHLALQYYAGLPVQSVAPVRRSFLDHYPGELVIIESVSRYPRLHWTYVQHYAHEAGFEVGDAEARHWADRLSTRLRREELDAAGTVAAVGPPLESADELPAFAQPIFAHQRRMYQQNRRTAFEQENPAMFRGVTAHGMEEFWPAFFYRFAGFESRTGANLNYAGRLRSATAHVLPFGWVVYHCPAPTPSPGTPGEDGGEGDLGLKAIPRSTSPSP